MDRPNVVDEDSIIEEAGRAMPCFFYYISLFTDDLLDLLFNFGVAVCHKEENNIAIFQAFGCLSDLILVGKEPIEFL